MMFISQVLIVFVLAFMVFSLLFLSWRIHYNANWRTTRRSRTRRVQQPLDGDHAPRAQLVGVVRVRHVDGHALSSNAVPALTHSLNNTVAMVDRMQQIAANPVVKLSLGSA